MKEKVIEEISKKIKLKYNYLQKIKKEVVRFNSHIQKEDLLIMSIEKQHQTDKKDFFMKLKCRWVKNQKKIGFKFIELFRSKKIDEHLFEKLEEQLILADVGIESTRKIIDLLTKKVMQEKLKETKVVYGLLKDEMAKILKKIDKPLYIKEKITFIILMVGVNGVGKTTTIGKLAYQFKKQGKSVMLAAGDTFRAAAVDQLQIWGNRNNIPVIAQRSGADSASVIFDAIQAAKSRNIDVLIGDTAGRLQNQLYLMKELKKIIRSIKKLDATAPHEVMLTIDANIGQNAINQVKLFHETIGLTGITLTKLDGTAKGGLLFSIADQFDIPIRFIGIGEHIEDLHPFNANEFIEAIFDYEYL